MPVTIYEKESYKIVGACFEVHREIGCEFLEAVYQECLEIMFRKQNIPFEREQEINIYFKNVVL